jgi:hypothetical protein
MTTIDAKRWSASTKPAQRSWTSSDTDPDNFLHLNKNIAPSAGA